MATTHERRGAGATVRVADRGMATGLLRDTWASPNQLHCYLHLKRNKKLILLQITHIIEVDTQRTAFVCGGGMNGMKWTNYMHHYQWHRIPSKWTVLAPHRPTHTQSEIELLSERLWIINGEQFCIEWGFNGNTHKLCQAENPMGGENPENVVDIVDLPFLIDSEHHVIRLGNGWTLPK